MKEMLKAYCQRAYATAHACEMYAGEVGFKLGFKAPWEYKKDRELAKYRQRVDFPAGFGIVPVAIFSVGVTTRLITSVVCSLILRTVYANHIKKGKS